MSGTTWLDLARAAGVSDPAQADYLLWNATAFPFDYPRAIFEQLRHALRHLECIDLLPNDYDMRVEAECEGSMHGPAHYGYYRRGEPTNCYPREVYDRAGRRIGRRKYARLMPDVLSDGNKAK